MKESEIKGGTLNFENALFCGSVNLGGFLHTNILLYLLIFSINVHAFIKWVVERIIDDYY